MFAAQNHLAIDAGFGLIPFPLPPEVDALIVSGFFADGLVGRRGEHVSAPSSRPSASSSAHKNSDGICVRRRGARGRRVHTTHR